MDEPTYYTHAEWRVRPGREAEFVTAWRALSEAFAALPARPLWGTLLQSEREPALFYSFGPWASAADIAAMRADPGARSALERVAALCEHATPGGYREVAHVDLRGVGT
jgi:quinol monooxygenase YgiN